MPNHFHAIRFCREAYDLGNVRRDMKQYPSAPITDAISNHVQESRRSRLLWLLKSDTDDRYSSAYDLLVGKVC